MDRTLENIKRIIAESIKEHLTDVSVNELEGNGSLYYMNGQNGTSFDWHVNDRLSSFMSFYDDKENLGAAKANVYKGGVVALNLYGAHGKEMVHQAEIPLSATEADLLRLAVLLKRNADDKDLFDVSIEEIDTDNEPKAEEVATFLEERKNHEAMIKRRELLTQKACVSRMIVDEGCQVGYMVREEPHAEEDSGWAFYGGEEDEEYVSDPNNFIISTIFPVVSADPVVEDYLERPVGSKLIRVSSDKFEEDEEEM